MEEEVIEADLGTKSVYKSCGWKCELFGMHTTITVEPSKENLPCWFWRTMQYLILGNKWTKEVKKSN